MYCARRKRISSTSCSSLRLDVRSAVTAMPWRSGTEKIASLCGRAKSSGSRISAAASTSPATYASAFASSSWMRREPRFFFLFSTSSSSSGRCGRMLGPEPRKRRREPRQRHLDGLLADRDELPSLGELSQAEARGGGERRLDQERRRRGGLRRDLALHQLERAREDVEQARNPVGAPTVPRERAREL